jgi:diadenosine tetraphosphate (Ap4A) HIT family hydrolase
VHAEDDHDVLAGRRGGGDHLLRAAVDVRPDAGRVGTDAGGLDDHVHAHLAPRQGGPTRPGITRLVTRLGRDWLAQQRPVPSDRRVALARLTPERRREKADALPALTRLAELAQHRPCAADQAHI